MKTLQTPFDGPLIVHNDRTPQQVVRERFPDSCVLVPREVVRSTNKQVDYLRTYDVYNREACEDRSDPGSYAGTLAELP